ncbi:serine hydrolase domain-containing protein [Nonomuraea sp. NPDC050556]|uniref:serine hydrolase domain-containing protein n=1 Tax=Nonomuraea sp. NPDC050556 TaxID=3364369 RepID=UPI0037A18A31
MGVHAVVALRHGEVFLEEYGEGEDFSWGQPLGHVRFGPDTLHDLRSVTKSVTGLLYGIALAEGSVPSPDEPVSSKRPELLVRHALTMTLGIEWDESVPYTSTANSEIAMEMADDRYEFILSRPLVEEPGTSWHYCGGATALIGKLIADGTGLTLEEFARSRLFAPLGISDFVWMAGDDGIASPASGLRLRPRDLAAIGQLVLDQGRDIVPASWIAEATQPKVAIDEGTSYGYQWWVCDDWVGGFGNGGQRLVVVPGKSLVIAVNDGAYDGDTSASQSVIDAILS